MNPMISVIMPIYNAEKRLEISIQSILNQSFTNFELILINDGSNDSSAEICEKYAEKDKRVHVIHQENQGVSGARNRGLEIAKGKYLNFIDADDTIELNTYDLLMQSVSSFDYDLVIYGMSFDYYKNDVWTNRKIKTVKAYKELEKKDIKVEFFDLYTNNYLSSSCNKLFKRSLIKDNKLKFDSKMAILEDLKFSLDTIDYIENILVFPNPFYHYYNDTSVSPFDRRPDIDYMENFRILDKRLRKTADELGLESKKDLREINSIIIRSYVIYMEYLFHIDLPWNEKYKKTKEFTSKHEIIRASKNASVEGFRLTIVNFFIKKGYNNLLFTLFFLKSSLDPK